MPAKAATALNQAEVGQRCLSELLRLQAEQTLVLRCGVIMPDHLHLLVSLGQTIDLSSVIRLFKGRMTPLLRQHQAAWQQSFYDHRLYPGEDLLPIFLYIFLNPYRKNLIPLDRPWPGYYCSTEDWNWFGPLTKENCPEPAWLR